jgi:type I restriction enzyme M protein
LEDDGKPFADKLARLTAILEEQFAESATLAMAIRANLAALGVGSNDAAVDQPS